MPSTRLFERASIAIRRGMRIKKEISEREREVLERERHPYLGADNGFCQFGVGFYSAFLVADRVVGSTKNPRSDKQYVWESVADSSSYVIREETDPEKLLPRGTQITLYLRPDDKYEFSELTRIQGLVKNYSQFIPSPSTHGKKNQEALRS
ncbi:Heat shock protein Hsp90 family [Macleaya cordata]|uniref:Heat shock protein Hsp90 family n=1 Tax=Macleaya cordata TaxID=56857 RepID=A0A200QDS6_MACCD|nr:Heat shock protein Hsp90 family [Macleaya cordata]